MELSYRFWSEPLKVGDYLEDRRMLKEVLGRTNSPFSFDRTRTAEKMKI
jgi:hypothetical protein